MNEDSEEALAVALARMSRDLLAQDTVQRTLDRIVEYPVALLEECEHAGILLLRGQHRVETAAATSELVHTSDRIQGELGEGPCFEAAVRKQPVYRIADVQAEEHRWPRFAPRAHELGIGSMMGLLLYTDEDEFGALDLYSSKPQGFNEESELLAWLLASHAAVAFSSARLEAQLHSAVDTRQVIGEAIGIVMERYKISEDQAFTVLKTSSQHRNVKLREIAQQVTETGEIPGAR